jgi:tellurite methyltransferase
MSSNQSITFFDTQFQKQVAANDFALNPFENACLSFVDACRIWAAAWVIPVLKPHGGGAEIVAIGLLMFFRRGKALALLSDIQAHVASRGSAVVNGLIEGTTYLGMFEPGNYHLFGHNMLEERFKGWDILFSRHDSFAAPGETRKEFATIVARKK